MRLEFETNTSTLSYAENEPTESSARASDTREALRQGIEAAQSGDRRGARALLLHVAQTEPRNEDAWLWLASVSEYPEELMIFLSNVLDVNPQNQRALEWMKTTKSLLAKTFVERGIDAAGENRTDFARQCFFQAAAHDPKSEMAWLWLASIADTTEEKQTHLARVLAVNPENADAQAALKVDRERAAQTLLRRASTLAMAGERAAALDTLTEILRASPRFEDALILKAHLTDDFAEKIQCFESVLESNPAHEAARSGLSSLNSLRNFAAPRQTAETSQSLTAADDSAEKSDFEPENGVAEFAADQNAAAEINIEKALCEETPETVFALPTASADAENEKRESEFSFGETPFEENADFGAVSFDSFEKSEQSEQNEQSKLELSDEVFEFDAAATESISDLSGELFNNFEAGDNFSATSAPQTDSFALSELEEDVFAPNETATVSDYSLPAIDLSLPEENFTDELRQPENDDSAAVAPPQSLSLEEETDVVEAVEFYAETSADVFEETTEALDKSAENSFGCPFCNAENDAQSYACGTCRAVLSLSELEMLLANQNADRETLERAVERMEEERNFGDFGDFELMSLGIGHINLKNWRRGFSFLQQASRSNPNNVVLSSQVNALALRLEEIERREENYDAPARSRTILVVDDSATVRKLISGKLEKSGHEVICAVDGMDALAKLSETPPDLILLDITMPRMDGYQVCKMIRGNPATKNIPVVMISGKDGFFDKVRGRMAGTTGYITKPFGPETLMKALDVYIKNTHEQIVSAEI